MSFERDKDYYARDGDFFVVVQTTIFKVHRHILGRDGSMFSNMFYGPNDEPNASIEGQSEDCPYRCDAEVDEFRALCWILYALPFQIQAQEGQNVDLPRLLSLALIANKYHFETTEKWVIGIILKHCATCTGINYLDSCTSGDLERVTDVAVKAGCKELLRVAEDKWLARLESQPHQSGDISSALDIAERYRLWRFLGEIYYQECLKMCDNLPDNSLVCDYSPQGWSDAHTRRLYRGFYTLSMLWDRIRKDGYKLLPTQPCSNLLACPCTTSLKIILQTNSKINDTKPIDILTRLKILQSLSITIPSGMGGSPRGINQVCQKQIWDAATTLHDDLREKLYLHFMD